jgi:hypothetical protein
LKNRKANVELYEQIRREVRKAFSSAIPAARKVPERDPPKLAAAIPFINAIRYVVRQLIDPRSALLDKRRCQMKIALSLDQFRSAFLAGGLQSISVKP